MKEVVISTLALGMLAWTGCSSDDTPVMQTSDFEPAESGIITTDQAKAIAQAAVKGISGETDSRATEKQFTDCRISMYPAESRSDSSEQLCYIVNFDDGGYAVVAADKRAPEVLAMNDDGSFAPEKDEAHHFFMDLAYEYLSTRDLSGLTPFDSTAVNLTGYIWHDGHRCSWDTFNNTEVTVDIRKLISTQWHQYSPFNVDCPIFTIWDDKLQQFKPKQAPAGCVTIALAQIMKYHNKPDYIQETQCNWELFDNYIYPFSIYSDEIASICHTLGLFLETKYGANGSSATVERELKVLLASGFTSAKSTDRYNESYIMSNLQDRYPVLITASGKEHYSDENGITKEDETCHMWIIDGAYRKKQTIIWTDLDRNCFCHDEIKVDLYLHCNWGWGRRDIDSNTPLPNLTDNGGYYLSGVFNTTVGNSTLTYNHSFSLIYDIF